MSGKTLKYLPQQQLNEAKYDLIEIDEATLAEILAT